MQDDQLLQLWQADRHKLNQSLVLNRQNAQDITQLKVQSLLGSMKPLKVFTLLVGLGWVLLVDSLLVVVFPYANLFFLISAGLQVLLTKLALGIYLYQFILIQQMDISAPILQTQQTLGRLRTSTLWVSRILFLQLPLWTTFYLSSPLLASATIGFYMVQGLVTLLFTVGGIWLFVNISYRNRDKGWFRLLFNDGEWTPVLKSMELLREIDAYQSEDAPGEQKPSSSK